MSVTKEELDYFRETLALFLDKPSNRETALNGEAVFYSDSKHYIDYTSYSRDRHYIRITFKSNNYFFTINKSNTN